MLVPYKRISYGTPYVKWKVKYSIKIKHRHWNSIKVENSMNI